MFYPRPTPSPWWMVLLVLPRPDTLIKYGQVTCTLLKTGRHYAKQKGKEHRRSSVL